MSKSSLQIWIIIRLYNCLKSEEHIPILALFLTYKYRSLLFRNLNIIVSNNEHKTITLLLKLR